MIPVSPKDLKGVSFILKKLFIQGTTIYGKRTLKPFYSKHLNKKLALKNIYEIAQAITNMYRNDGYILSKAIVPPQKINNGVVYLKIVEGYIDKINLQGPIRGPRKLINQYRKKILKSRPLRALDLERYLLLIDDLPGVTAKSVLTPSENKPNATTMTLILTDKAFEGHVGTDNRGSKFNGPYEYSGDLTANT
jgi:hemolysin activation/secretion protein